MIFPWKPRPEEIPDMLGLFSFQGQKTEAEKFFLKAIELDPTKGNCYMHYGLYYLILFLLNLHTWAETNAKIMRFMNLHIASTLALLT